MDTSVVVLDDSHDSVQIVEDDVEEGELNEDPDEGPQTVSIAASKSSPAQPQPDDAFTEPSPGTINSEAQNGVQAQASTGVVFEVKFRQKEVFDRLQERMLETLNAAFPDQQLVYKSNALESTIEAYDASEFLKTPALPKSPSPPADEQLFLIDTAPTVRLNAAQVPSYRRCNTEVLDEQTALRKKLKADAVNKCFRPKAQASCFNCGDTDHSLRECPRPRNHSKIQKARKKISQRAERYHVDAEQRFGHLQPGRISTKTRHALGYSRGELPFMFYRLRVMGYPPAWLEEAKVLSSGMALFNADGSEVLKSDDEDGESDTFKYDINKIVDFPGFNVQPGDKFFDDFKHHNVPRFQEHQLKENFIKSLGENVIKGYKRKKLLDLPPTHDASPVDQLAKQTNCVEHDMEVEDEEEEPPLPSKAPPQTPPPPPPLTPEETEPKRSPSPTLADLKEQQEQLLQQLASNTSVEIETAPSTPQKVTAASFKASYEGTPVLKFSVFDKLPAGDNFKVGVSDVINFENLPDSTGKYEQMKDLLKNVRQKMTQLQNDDEK